MNAPDVASPFRGSIFTFLSSLFARHNVRAVLVGGYALIANKVQRMTFDIDFMVTASDCAKIEPDVLSAGYSVLNRTSSFVQFKSEKPGLRDLDFLIGDPQTVGTLIAEGAKVSIAGETFVVPKLQHLIAMKLHAMAGNKKRRIKDLPDVVQLMAANGIDPRSKEIKALFQKYHALDLYKEVLVLAGSGYEEER
jgi:hypothetical protein